MVAVAVGWSLRRVGKRDDLMRAPSLSGWVVTVRGTTPAERIGTSDQQGDARLRTSGPQGQLTSVQSTSVSLRERWVILFSEWKLVEAVSRARRLDLENVENERGSAFPTTRMTGLETHVRLSEASLSRC